MRTKYIPIKVYCEHGALTKDIKNLQSSGVIELFKSPHENKAGRIKDAKPSGLTWSDHNKSWDSVQHSWQEEKSEIFSRIETILGGNGQNRGDCLHLDSAYKEGCQIFLTPDIKDIVLKREKLYSLLNIRIFNPNDNDDIEQLKNHLDHLTR